MSNILPDDRAGVIPWGMSARRRQRLGQGDALVVRQRGDSERAHSSGRIGTLLPRARVGQYRIETRGAPLMRLAVSLDKLLTVGDLDGQWVILLRHAPDEFQPPADLGLFQRVPKSPSAPPAQAGEPVEL